MSVISKQNGAIVKSLTGTVNASATANIKPGYNFKVTSMEVVFYLNGLKKIETSTDNELITIQLKEGSTNIQDNPQEIWAFNNHSKLQTYKSWVIPTNTQIDITIAHTNAATPGYTGKTLTFYVSFNGYEMDQYDEELKNLKS